jgi:hypothetical protein
VENMIVSLRFSLSLTLQERKKERKVKSHFSTTPNAKMPDDNNGRPSSPSISHLCAASPLPAQPSQHSTNRFHLFQFVSLSG